LAPSASEEILIYQTLLGAWPRDPEQESAFAERVNEFLVKALREAKENSSWIAPHQEYESAVQQFVVAILAADSEFLADLREFAGRLARYGATNGLAQVVLKIAAPGVPDFYQGCELWQFSLVDPDNRRPVDYKRRTAMLEALRKRVGEDPIALIRELASDPQRDESKLLVTWRGLEFRKSNRDLFARGDYTPLTVRGACAGHVCAFARRLEGRWAAAIVPRWTTQVTEWGDTAVVLPEGAPAEWQDVITGLIPASWRMADLLGEFPVALLKGAG
jgi:(1->4)-alpha-D-glucan 1-alpha-D-glucosylmutase